MIPVYAISTNIVSSLGMDTAAHWQNISAGKTGIRLYTDASLSAVPFYASKLDPSQWQVIQAQTHTPDKVLSPFEQMCIYSAQRALSDHDVDPDSTVLILSATKGNIEWLGQTAEQRLLLPASAAIIAQSLGLRLKPVVVSQACVSGVAALQYGLRTLQAGRCRNAVIIGCDRFSRFVLSGFQALQAVADEPCRPFDAARKGISLGEAVATIVLSVEPDAALARLAAGATSNDANHISGPSRTGEELFFAINRAMHEAGIAAAQVDMISAHGTGTLYNDEMEAKAFGLSGLLHSPVHSFKGYLGHTLGAAGVLESAIAIEAMHRGQLVPSAGFETLGVSQPLNITKQMQPARLNYVLKTASGFGGSNAAAIWAQS